jgi:hypothetical protein
VSIVLRLVATDTALTKLVAVEHLLIQGLRWNAAQLRTNATNLRQKWTPPYSDTRKAAIYDGFVCRGRSKIQRRNAKKQCGLPLCLPGRLWGCCPQSGSAYSLLRALGKRRVLRKHNRNRLSPRVIDALPPCILADRGTSISWSGGGCREILLRRVDTIGRLCAGCRASTCVGLVRKVFLWSSAWHNCLR